MLHQIFNTKRFANYSKYSLLVNWRKKLFLTAGLIIAYVFVIVFSLKINRNYNNWEANTGITFIVASLIIISSAFPAFRKKESTMHFLCIPASNFEKYIYELFSRLTALFVFVPLMMILVGNITIKLHAIIEASRHHLLEPRYYTPLSFDILPNSEKGTIALIIFSLAIISILFAGTTVFRKNPLIKTLLFFGSITGVISAYVFYITQKLMPQWLGGTTGFIKSSNLNEDQWAYISLAGLTIFILWSLTYAFFKLKEKEI